MRSIASLPVEVIHVKLVTLRQVAPKLLIKLTHVLKNFQVCNWISSFVTCRQQYVLYEETPSEVLNVCSGVPQGSVFDPLLLLIFIKDVVDECEVKIRLYVDDCVIYSVIHSRSDQLKLNTELDRIM